MINSPVRLVAAAMCLFVASVAGCGGDGARDFGGTDGGNTGTGGGPAGHGGGAAGASGAGGSGGSIIMGSGGNAPTGGTVGSGGRNGGSGGTGGRATGGSGGSGGQQSGTGGRGLGGATASGGGIGSGGRVGAGGTGGANQASCDSLAAEYQTEMPAAKSCVIAAPVAECQIMVASALGCGMNCVIYVQDATALNRTLDKWNVSNCDSIPRLCPAIACINPQKGVCALTTAGLTQCQNAAAATTN